MKLSSLLVACSIGTIAGCHSPSTSLRPPPAPTFTLEPPRPLSLPEPVYLLKPSAFAIRDFMAVFIPQTVVEAGSKPLISVHEIGPEGVEAPRMIPESRRILRSILDDLPSHLPRRAIFLISGQGVVVEVVFEGARDRLNERLFAARLRGLRFTPAKQKQVSIAVICAVDLADEAREPNKAPEPTPGSVTTRAHDSARDFEWRGGARVAPDPVVAHL